MMIRMRSLCSPKLWHRITVIFLLVLLSPLAAEAQYWIEYTEEWRSANSRMIAEGVMPERIGPFDSRDDAQSALNDIAGASGVSDGIGWSSCMGQFLYVSGSGGGSSPSGGRDYDWAAYYAEQAELRRLAEEARRRAEEEDRQRVQQRQQQFSATHAGALGQVQGRPWTSGGSEPSSVDLPPVSLRPGGQSAAGTPTRIDTTAFGNLVLRTLQVPVPLPGEGGWRGGDRLPENDEPLARIWLSPQAAALLGTIGRSIRNAPAKFGEIVIGALGGEAYLNVIKVNKALSDDAVKSTDEALALIRRGYPEPETTRFLRDREMRSLRIVVGNISDIPVPEDEAELEADGRRWFRWLTRGRGR
jgi:hypothetical protein